MKFIFLYSLFQYLSTTLFTNVLSKKNNNKTLLLCHFSTRIENNLFFIQLCTLCYNRTNICLDISDQYAPLLLHIQGFDGKNAGSMQRHKITDKFSKGHPAGM